MNKKFKFYAVRGMAVSIGLIGALAITACGNKSARSSEKVATDTEATQTQSAEEVADELSEEQKTAAEEIDKEIASWNIANEPASFGTVTLADYSVLKAEDPEIPEVTDEDVDDYIFETTLRYAGQSKDEVALGDAVSGDFKSEELGDTEGQEIVIGKAEYSKELDDALIGHKVGDEVSVTYTLPDDYYDTDHAGKNATVSVTILGVRSIPELSDDIAKDNGYETADAWKESVREELTAQYKSYEESAKSYSIYESLLSASTFELNDEALDWLMKFFIKEDAAQIEADDSDYSYGKMLAENNLTLDSVLESLKEDFSITAKMIVMDAAVLEKEGIEITDEDINNYLTEYGYESRDEAISETTEFLFNCNVKDDKVRKILVSKLESAS